MCVVRVAIVFLCSAAIVFDKIAAISDTRLAQGSNINLGDALQFLREYDSEASGMCFRVSSAQWNYATNITDFNKRRMIEEQTLRAKFERISWKKAVSFEWSRLPDPMARRQLRMLVTEGRALVSIIFIRHFRRCQIRIVDIPVIRVLLLRLLQIFQNCFLVRI